jgi:hypothetical protein
MSDHGHEVKYSNRLGRRSFRSQWTEFLRKRDTPTATLLFETFETRVLSCWMPVCQSIRCSPTDSQTAQSSL